MGNIPQYSFCVSFLGNVFEYNFGGRSSSTVFEYLFSGLEMPDWMARLRYGVDPEVSDRAIGSI